MTTSTQQFTITKGNLHFAMSGNGFVCQEMQTLGDQFLTRWTPEEIQQGIDRYVAALRANYEKRYPSQEEHKAVAPDERKRLGGEIFDSILPSVQNQVASQGLTLFQQFLFWLGYWWYYHPEIRTKLVRIDQAAFAQPCQELVNEYIVPVLPDQVRESLQEAEPVTVAVGYGHFALLFCHRRNKRRRFIVTDTSLYTYEGVSGYRYLDILPDGRPVARSVCDRGGERAFFDGIRLMSHRQFQTCAPKTVVIDGGGYKVNSTQCTIINGYLYPLVDMDDAVAHTTGAWGIGPMMRICDFTNTDAVTSYQQSEQSGARMRVAADKVTLDGVELKPIGVFQPSATRLLDNGFTSYDWSEFVEIDNYRYSRVMAIDDKQSWLDEVWAAFGEQLSELQLVCTTDRNQALSLVLERQPDCLLLDVHLTPDESFEGLWIANQLHDRGFKGQILLCSSYKDDKLQAMRTLVKGGTCKAPGKDLKAIRRCLIGKDK